MDRRTVFGGSNACFLAWQLPALSALGGFPATGARCVSLGQASTIVVAVSVVRSHLLNERVAFGSPCLVLLVGFARRCTFLSVRPEIQSWIPLMPEPLHFASQPERRTASRFKPQSGWGDAATLCVLVAALWALQSEASTLAIGGTGPPPAWVGEHPSVSRIPAPRPDGLGRSPSAVSSPQRTLSSYP